MNNHLLGYLDNCCDPYMTSAKSRIVFPGGVANVIPDNRKMGFSDTQGNISDESGNLLMSSNGIWIADASGDTMMNGSGLNPGAFANAWSSDGVPMSNANLFLPYPNDSTKYVLFHMIGNNSLDLMASELYYSVIDITQNGGLGKVILKNQIAFQDTLSWGIGACRHANGRDWWIIVLKDNSDIIYKVLFTTIGIQNVSTQSVGLPKNFHGNSCQLSFSPNGKKFAYTSGYGPSPWYTDVRLFNFDRCSGLFSDYINMPLNDGYIGFATAFSSNSKYLYTCSTNHIFQINTDTSSIASSFDSVATNDGFYSPFPNLLDNFWLMNTGPDGKIYITAGNSVVDLHYINLPDSDGVACNVRQHAINMLTYHYRSVPNHPNYYLGCDTASSCSCLTLNTAELSHHDFHFSIYPNPITNHKLKISYLLPQNQKGLFEMFDVNGRNVFTYALPQ
jgi:hypothetical protein